MVALESRGSIELGNLTSADFAEGLPISNIGTGVSL